MQVGYAKHKRNLTWPKMVKVDNSTWNLPQAYHQPNSRQAKSDFSNMVELFTELYRVFISSFEAHFCSNYKKTVSGDLFTKKMLYLSRFANSTS